MKPLGLVIDPVFEEHDTGPGHPERPERLRHLRQQLDQSKLGQAGERVEPRPATDEMLAWLHDPAHIERVDRTCAAGERFLDSMDVTICPESPRVARLAAGSVVELCRRVADGELERGFAAVRPPGHHAERDLAMGFCLFNNVAVAAEWLIRERGLSRVLIVDWDVHHGNGTQHLFEERSDVFYFSCHQYPLYPGTGTASEVGRGAGEGTTLNCPLPPGSGDEAFLATLREQLTPAAKAFAPEFVLISAGFDAHRADPLAQLEVSTPAFGEATRIVRGLADELAGGRVVAALEGGYDISALAESVEAHLDAMLESAT
jgi:acetoin utilization deacetylase AcuC-like enzyme